MVLAAALLLFFLLLFAPQWWAARTLRHYGRERPEIPGTGGELARHLLDRHGLDSVMVETAGEGGDHYDPEHRCVRLSPAVLTGKSLTAIAVAAHETGHALQHAQAWTPLRLRQGLIRLVQLSEKSGAVLLIALPFMTLLTRAPGIGAVLLLLGLGSLALPVLVHLITLPVELDASRRALAMLASGYVPEAELPALRRILNACALTYLAASLATLLNFWRWIRILRR